jgi:hypothetical protein
MPSDGADWGSVRVSVGDLRAASASTLRIDFRVQERGLVGAQFRDGFARPLVNRPASFRGAPVKPFHGAGEAQRERRHLLRLYCDCSWHSNTRSPTKDVNFITQTALRQFDPLWITLFRHGCGFQAK